MEQGKGTADHLMPLGDWFLPLLLLLFLLLLLVGMRDPCGHVDFYPNGGEDQPGCQRDLLEAVNVDGPLWGVREFIGCNHRRAALYFTGVQLL